MLPKCIVIRNLDRFQHYKNRRPPWVKLHRELLDDMELMRLHAASKWLAVCSILIASEVEHGKCLPADASWWSWRLRCPVKEANLQDLLSIRFMEPCLQHASSALAPCLQHATSEGEERQSREETERETEADSRKRASASPTYSVGFVRFWKIANRGSKKRAFAEWSKQKLEPKVDALISVYEIQVERKCELRRAGSFVRQFQDTERWLRNQRWEDDLEELTENRNG